MITISPSTVTGEALRSIARELIPWRDGIPNSECLNRLSRLAFLMGASESRTTRNRSFDTLLTLIDRHLVDTIIPKCNPKYLWLPDLTGKGWRSDLGIPRGDRFTLWLYKVALFGHARELDWAFPTQLVKTVTYRQYWKRTDLFRTLLKERWAIEKMCAIECARWNRFAKMVQRVWRAYRRCMTEP